MTEEWRAANLRYYPYYGRGDIQLTWFDNYKSAEVELNMPGLTANPDLALEPERAARIFAWFWQIHGIGPVARAGNWRRVRTLVLGAETGWERIQMVADRLL